MGKLCPILRNSSVPFQPAQPKKRKLARTLTQKEKGFQARNQSRQGHDIDPAELPTMICRLRPLKSLGQNFQAPAYFLANQLRATTSRIQGISGKSGLCPSIVNDLSWHPSIHGATACRSVSLVARCSACFQTFIKALESSLCRLTNVGISSCKCWIMSGANDSMMRLRVTPLYSDGFVSKTYF